MLNVIQHGVTIANLRIQRKEQQCGLRNIGDRGEGLLNHVGTFRSDQSEQYDKIQLKHTNTYTGIRGQECISCKSHYSSSILPHHFTKTNNTYPLLDSSGRARGTAVGHQLTTKPSSPPHRAKPNTSCTQAHSSSLPCHPYHHAK